MRKKPKEWVPDAVWLNICALSSLDSFRELPDSVFHNDGLWRQWYDQEAPETAKVRARSVGARGRPSVPQPAARPLLTPPPRARSAAAPHPQVPDYEGRLSKFERMCVVKTFREDRTLVAAADYIADALGQRFVESVPLSMERAWAESHKKCPLICLLSPGARGAGWGMHRIACMCSIMRASSAPHAKRHRPCMRAHTLQHAARRTHARRTHARRTHTRRTHATSHACVQLSCLLSHAISLALVLSRSRMHTRPTAVGSDPTKLIEDLAKRKKVKTLGVSMGQGQEVIARKLLATAAAEGQWVLLQNTHLGLGYLSEVEAFLSKAEELHDDFR